MNIIIRKVKEEELYQAANVIIGGWQSAYKGIIDDNYLNSMNVDDTVKKWRSKGIDNDFVVAILNDEVVGVARYAPFTDEIDKEFDCELWALYVRCDMKGLGIGTKLINYVKNEFKCIDKKRMIIWCLKDNIPSRMFYEAMGGKLVSYEKEQVRDGKVYKEVGFSFDL